MYSRVEEGLIQHCILPYVALSEVDEQIPYVVSEVLACCCISMHGTHYCKSTIHVNKCVVTNNIWCTYDHNFESMLFNLLFSKQLQFQSFFLVDL